ncbi:ester cyclase [Tundrisphaera lichenicola]|uniref:ester cyclase n=1 Tax=Tundrisphaera lichenicola TaxID=2029860 RepID=UPI003EB862FF
MSAQNRALARRWFEEAWNQRSMATIDELLSPECIGHMESGEVPGIEPFKQLQGEFLAAFPDLKVEVEDIVSDGDDVVVRWRAIGTHTGDGLGLDPTDQPISIRGMTWQHFQDGKMVEGWDSWNQEGLLSRLREGPEEPRKFRFERKARLADRLRDLRRDLFGDHGGPRMARLLGLPARTWYNYETGVTVPAEVLLDLIDQTGVRPAWLLKGEEPCFEGRKRPEFPDPDPE